MKKRIVWFFLVTSALSGPLCAADGPIVTGIWSKVYFTQGDRKEFDSRWSLELSLLNDGTFQWESSSLQEKWLVETATGKRTTEVTRVSMELKGTYSISGENVTFRFFPVPEGEAATCASLNLGYDAATREGKMTVKVEKDKLILSITPGKRTFVFGKKDVLSNQSAGGDGKHASLP